MTLFQRYLYRNYQTMASIRQWLERRITPVGALAITGLGLTALRGADTTLSVTYQAFAFLAILVPVAWVSLWFFRGRFSIQRHLPRIGSAGVPLAYQISIENLTRRNQSGLSMFENLADGLPTLKEFVENPEPGEEKRNWLDRRYGYYRWQWLANRKRPARVERTPVPPLRPGERLQLKMQLLPLRRGVLRFEGTTIVCPDPFGLFLAWQQAPAAQSVLILPKRYPLPPVDLPGTRKYQPRGIALASAVGESEEFMSLRDYRPGDPLRSIHWKSFAKLGKPIVKEFQDEFFVRYALILDTFSGADFSDRFEEAVSVAASFACTLLTQDSLLDLLFVGPQAFCFTAGRGVAHTEQMLEILASVRICHDQPFQSLAQRVLHHASTVSGCICIFLAWDQERQDFIRKLKALDVPLRVLVITDPGVPLDPGPLRDHPEWFWPLEMGRIAEDLAAHGQ